MYGTKKHFFQNMGVRLPNSEQISKAKELLNEVLISNARENLSSNKETTGQTLNVDDRIDAFFYRIYSLSSLEVRAVRNSNL